MEKQLHRRYKDRWLCINGSRDDIYALIKFERDDNKRLLSPWQPFVVISIVMSVGRLYLQL